MITTILLGTIGIAGTTLFFVLWLRAEKKLAKLDKSENKEQQIKEIEQFIYDYVDSKRTKGIYLFGSCVNELAKPFVHNKGIAEALYNAGYRKVPDCAVILTPKERDEELKACNEKQAELENEIERLKADNEALKMWNEAYTEENKKLKIYNDKLCQGIYWGNGEHFSISIEKAKQNAVKEFAEKLKAKAVQEAEAEDYVCYIVDRLLKEYEK